VIVWRDIRPVQDDKSAIVQCPLWLMLVRSAYQITPYSLSYFFRWKFISQFPWFISFLLNLIWESFGINGTGLVLDWCLSCYHQAVLKYWPWHGPGNITQWTYFFRRLPWDFYSGTMVLKLSTLKLAYACVGWSVASVALCVHALKEKRFELSTPNLVHIYFMAGPHHALTLRLCRHGYACHTDCSGFYILLLFSVGYILLRPRKAVLKRLNVMKKRLSESKRNPAMKLLPDIEKARLLAYLLWSDI